MNRTSRIAGCLLTVASLALAACGGAGSSDLSAPPTSGQTIAPSISPASLPEGSVGVEYQAQFALSDASSATWTVVGGSLPAGLTLEADGSLTGRPEADGVYVFRVQADGEGTRTVAEYPLAVDALGLHVSAGLVGGEAWVGREVSISAVGARSTVLFRLEGPAEGDLTPEGGDAVTLTAAPLAAEATEGSLRVVAEESGTGRTAALDLVVRPDPTSEFAAAFGSSDVWHVDVSAKTGAHAFATDFHAALARLGFRAPGSTDLEGTEADRLAETYVHLHLLRALRRHYSADGVAPLPITFPFARPQGAVAPAPGARLSGASNRYSVMRLEWSSERGVFATGLVDTRDNAGHEHDASANGDEHGVFLQVVVEHLERFHGLGFLRNDPVGDADVATLRDLLQGLPPTDTRGDRLAAYAEAIGRALARVVAHEIGHGLGLGHTDPPQANSLMNATIELSPWEEWTFTPAALEQLEHEALPGVGRTAAVSKMTMETEESEPVGTCGCALHAAR